MDRSRLTLVLALTLSTTGACAHAEDTPLPDSAPGGAPTTLPSAPTTGGVSAAHAGATGSGGAGLTSSDFGSEEGPRPEAETCDPLPTAACDWSRVDGCCRDYACERASGADVFNTYPVESCQGLVACVQDNEGCSTASDPLCFQNEAPGAPCLSEGYQASHEDPDGPFAWTTELVRCVCGY